MAVRWGILGSGFISSDFTNCLKSLPSSDHQIVAVGCRDLKNAKDFATKFGVVRAYGSYKELIEDPDVEIGYVGTINSNHFELSKQLLENGKHVLCEKPMCLTVKQTKELVAVARAKNLFLMEGIWSRFFPVFERLRQEIASGNLGRVIQVNATFGRNIIDVERVTSKALGGGSIGDIGVYPLQLMSLVFGGRRPKKLLAVGQVNSDGVDEAMAISVAYEGGELASLNFTCWQDLESDAYVIGTKGFVKIENPFWCPSKLILPNKEVLEFPLPQVNGPVNFPNSEGLCYEANAVAQYLRKGLKESPLITLDESILLAELREEAQRQVGVLYDCD